MRRILLASITATLMGIGGTAAFAMPHWQMQGQRATSALNLLESRGYGGFTDFHAVGRNFAANLMRDGKTVHVLVNPSTNQIQTQA